MSNPHPLIIANLKANKTWEEISLWINEVGEKAQSFSGTIIVCPSFPFIVALNQIVKSKNYNIKIAAQDVSQFEQGAYTGEVAASQIANVCSYTIIGHSERRKNLNESEEMLEKKVNNAKNANIEPIFCVQGKETPIPNGINIVAYEPVFAIGTGNSDNPKNIEEVANAIKSKGNYSVIYGGSVTKNNVSNFLKEGLIDGVLVGTDSKNAQDFIAIIETSK